jgi:RNA polymerase sigma-70 factor (ECF subfamily)
MSNQEFAMANNAERFEALVEAYSGDLYRYAYWLSRNPNMAEDLVQETFMRAWRFLDSLNDESKAKSWLITTLRRENARQYERYRPQMEELELETIEDPRSSNGQGSDVDAVRDAMSRLPDNYREPLILQVLWGYSGEEIADLMEMPRASVNTRLFRARQMLRKIMAGEEDAITAGERV